MAPLLASKASPPSLVNRQIFLCVFVTGTVHAVKLYMRSICKLGGLYPLAKNMLHSPSIQYIYIQWNLSYLDTLGTEESVLISEVS